jgi:hypothetical protein
MVAIEFIKIYSAVVPLREVAQTSPDPILLVYILLIPHPREKLSSDNPPVHRPLVRSHGHGLLLLASLLRTEKCAVLIDGDLQQVHFVPASDALLSCSFGL